MKKIKINWISEISDYEVESPLKVIINKILEDFKRFLNFQELDIILIPNARNPGFQNTLERYKEYFLNPSDLKFLSYNEDGYALFVPNTLLKNLDLCLIVVKVFKFMGVSTLHEIFHKLFENSKFKSKFMPKNYSKEGANFKYYLEDFFVEFLAIDLNCKDIFTNKSDIDEYLELNNITEKALCERTLNIYEGFRAYGKNDYKGLTISLLSCYYIFFSSWRVIKKKRPEFEILFKNLWVKILNIKELNFFKKNMTNMMKIFINEDLNLITDKMQILFNQL